MVRRSGAIDIYKLFFAVYVVLYHSCLMVEDRSVACARGGWLAVEFFFIVSGYLMVSSAKRITDRTDQPILIGKETFYYVIGKIRTILPYYIFAYIFSFVVMHLFNKASFPVLKNALLDSIIPTLFLENTGIWGKPVVAATWYLSAMYIAMMVMFPLLLKNRDYFLWVFSPLVVAIGYGYMLQTYNSLPGSTWHVLSYANTLRAFTGLCLGACCYLVANSLSEKKLSVFQKVILTMAELLFIACSAKYLWNDVGDNLVKAMLCFSGLTVLSFSGQSYFSGILNRLNTRHVAQYSVCLYLCHGRLPSMVKRFMQTEDYGEMLPLYVLLAMLLSLICLLTVEVILALKGKKASRKKI